jgi:hypothetical protein
MASIGSIDLGPITINVANATVDVDVEVKFTSYDVNSNQPYRMVCRLMGDDTPEGNPDEVIPGGSLTPAITLGGVTIDLGQAVQADGLTSKTFTFNKTLPKANLNEDTGAEPNPDEIQAEVTLTPILPTTVTKQSNVQTLVA